MDSFELTRGDGSNIENEFQNNKSDYLGIIFSGLGYSYKNPLLYYTRNILLESKLDYFGIEFGYSKNRNFLGLSRELRSQFFYNDNGIIINKISELSNNYKRIILIGKSLGTSTVRQCIKYESIRSKSAIILLTPSNEWEPFIDEIKTIDNRVLVIGSLADKLYTVKNLSDIYRKKNIDLYELKTADHSLEVNDTLEDIEELKVIIKKIKKFIGKAIKTVPPVKQNIKLLSPPINQGQE